MAKRRTHKDDTSDIVWECPTCIQQMLGKGVRCMKHNPTPEEREAHPELYVRGVYAPSVKEEEPIA